MDNVQQYIITLTAASLFTGAITAFFSGKTSIGAVIKLLAGLFMVATMMTPLLKLDALEFSEITGKVHADALAVTASGKELAQKEIEKIIIQQTQTYIEDKATSLGLELEITVQLGDSMPPVPVTVTICGQASPYAKRALIQYIANNLAVPEEKQIWI